MGKSLEVHFSRKSALVSSRNSWFKRIGVSMQRKGMVTVYLEGKNGSVNGVD